MASFFPHYTTLNHARDFGKFYSTLPQTQLDFLDKKATLTSLTRNSTDHPGMICGTPIWLEARRSYRIIVKGTARPATQAILFAYAARDPARTTLLDREDVALPTSGGSTEGATTLMTGSSRPLAIRFGVWIQNPKVGDEFSLDWIRIEQMEGTVEGHWRTVSDAGAHSTSYYDPISGRWITKTVEIAVPPPS